ncbi:hypothetical protein V5799_027956, partial [Amblyomma americanum]
MPVLFSHSFVCEKDVTPPVHADDESCKYDNLTIYEGNSTSSPVLGGPWCGTTGAPGNYSVASSVLLMFRTDSSSAGKGFRLWYRISLSLNLSDGVYLICTGVNQGCGGTLRTESGTLAPPSRDSSGSYPGGPLNCLWTLVSRSGYGLELNVTALSLGSGTLPCTAGSTDFLEYLQQPPVRLCGHSVPQEWLKPHASASRVQLLLDTGRRGGQAKLKLEYGAMQDANLTYSQPSGVIHNVDYPGWTTIDDYPTVLTIAPVNTSSTSALALYFVRFNVGDTLNNSCQNAYMQVRDGGATSRVLAHVCGDVNPSPVFSTGNRLSVIVKNAGAGRVIGAWSVRYIMVYITSPEGAPAGCGGNVTASEGALSSPGFPATFAQRRTCTWFVTGRARATLQLSFVAFAFNSSAAACEANYLEVYDGHRDSPDAKITRLCGQ